MRHPDDATDGDRSGLNVDGGAEGVEAQHIQPRAAIQGEHRRRGRGRDLVESVAQVDRRQVDELVQARIEDDFVVPTRRRDLEAFRAREVDPATAAAGQHATQVRDDEEQLCGVRALELHHVGPGEAVEIVDAFAHEPGQPIVAGPADDRVVSEAAADGVVAFVAVDDVVAVVAVDRVVARAAMDDVAALAGQDPVIAGGAVDLVEYVAVAALQQVVAGASGDRVVHVSAVDRHPRHRLNGWIRGKGVEPVEHLDRDDLGCAEVDGDPSHVARQRRALTTRRKRVDLVGAVAPDVERVAAGAAVDEIVAVVWRREDRPGDPMKAVVPASAVDAVVAAPRIDEIVAGSASDDLGADPAGDRVVAVAAVDDRRRRVRERPSGLVDEHGVVATAGADRDRGKGRPQEAADEGGPLPHFDPQRVSGHSQRDRVPGGVARDPQLARHDTGRDRRRGRSGRAQQARNCERSDASADVARPVGRRLRAAHASIEGRTGGMLPPSSDRPWPLDVCLSDPTARAVLDM